MLVKKLRNFKICTYFHDSKTMYCKFQNDSNSWSYISSNYQYFPVFFLQTLESIAINSKFDIFLV